MVMASVSVSLLLPARLVTTNDLVTWSGWYDCTYDEELGSQPCIFTSVTPVSSILTPSTHVQTMLQGLEQRELDPAGGEDQVTFSFVSILCLIDSEYR